MGYEVFRHTKLLQPGGSVDIHIPTIILAKPESVYKENPRIKIFIFLVSVKS